MSKNMVGLTMTGWRGALQEVGGGLSKAIWFLNNFSKGQNRENKHESYF